RATPCAAQACFRSSSSMGVLSVVRACGPVQRFAQLASDAAELRADIRGRDAQHLADRLVIVALEVEQHERPVERPQLADAAEQPLDLSTGRGGLDDEEVLVDLRRTVAVPSLAAIERDRDVQRDPVDPGRVAIAIIVARPRSPELHRDLLYEVLAIRHVPAVRTG